MATTPGIVSATIFAGRRGAAAARRHRYALLQLARIPPLGRRGRARRLRPCSSDLDFLRDIKRVIDLDAEVADRAFNLGVAQEQLDGSQIASTSIDQGRLGPAHGVRGVLER